MSINVKQNTQKGKVEIQARILNYLESYSEVIGIEDWGITVGFKKLGSEILAECEAEVEYRRALITFDSVKLEEEKEVKVKRTVIHELLHCLVWRLAEQNPEIAS